MSDDTGNARGDIARLWWCDLRPGSKADAARAMWQRARRQKLRVEVKIQLGPETRIATVTSCRRLPSGRVRLRFDADPVPLVVGSAAELESAMGRGAMGSKRRETRT